MSPFRFLILALVIVSPFKITAQRSNQIQEAQQQLASLGYDIGRADGVSGSRTAAAIKKFQRGHLLPETGQLDSKTESALRMATQSAVPDRKVTNSAAVSAQEEGALENIVPVRSDLEAEGLFVWSGGRVQGSGKVVKAGSYLLNGGPAKFPCDVQMGLRSGRYEVTVPAGCDFDSNMPSALWLPGIVHEIRGQVKDLGADGFIFDSDPSQPLRFKLVTGRGYVYQGGKGSVVEPNGKRHAYDEATASALGLTPAKSSTSPLDTAARPNVRVGVIASSGFELTAERAFFFELTEFPKITFICDKGSAATWGLMQEYRGPGAFAAKGDLLVGAKVRIVTRSITTARESVLEFEKLP